MRTVTKVAIVGLTAGSMIGRSCVRPQGVVRSHRDRRARDIGIADTGRWRNACQTCLPAIAVTLLLIPTKAPLQ
jgi:hypothetical protein